jgi:hypothetical protein
VAANSLTPREAPSEQPHVENPDRMMRVCDAFGQPIQKEKPKPVGIFAVLDSSKCVEGIDCGSVVSLHKSITAARPAAAKTKHGRVLQLKTSRAWDVGDHANGRTDVVFSNTARFG